MNTLFRGDRELLASLPPEWDITSDLNGGRPMGITFNYAGKWHGYPCCLRVLRGDINCVLWVFPEREMNSSSWPPGKSAFIARFDGRAWNVIDVQPWNVV
jgi:hypothetical protein